MITAHEILIAAIVSLLAFSASTSILLGDSAATAPYAGATGADLGETALQAASGVLTNPAHVIAQA